MQKGRNDPFNQSYPYPPQPGYQQPMPGYQPPMPGYQQQPPYPPGGILPIHGDGGGSSQQKFGGAAPPPQQPNIGFINPGYPPPQSSGFVPLVPPQGVPYGHIPPQRPGGYIDPEDPLGPEVKGFDFSEQSIRKGFIRKVYSILTCQLAVTLGVIFLFTYEGNTRLWVGNHIGMFYAALVIMFASLIAMACCENVRRKSPTNFVVLGIFTLAESYMVAMSTFRFQSEDVLLAIGLTTAVCLGLTIFAFQTKWDFTMMGGILFVALILLFLFGIIAMFLPGKTMTLVYSSCGAILFSFYLIYDTQMMMGGTHKLSVSPEDYVFAALTLYLDIINIFIYILSIIGASKD